MTQLTHKVLMVRPANFFQNPQTLSDNSFQIRDDTNSSIHKQALSEFDALVLALEQQGVDVCLIQDTLSPETPDSIFPNNCYSFHGNGLAVIYPMKAPNRQLERQLNVFNFLESEKKFKLTRLLNLTDAEKQNSFLEGTGSMVLDRVNKLAFAAQSQRTDPFLFKNWCSELGYFPIIFDAGYIDQQNLRHSIYHTNVILSIGEKIALIVDETIQDKAQRRAVLRRLEQTNKKILTLSLDQMHHFCGNILQLKTNKGGSVFALSQTAFDHLSSSQISTLEQLGDLVVVDISTIEKASGGSVRCMLAEVF